MNERPMKALRLNVLALAAAVTGIVLGAMWIGSNVEGEAISTASFSIATIGVTGLVAYGKDILTIDSKPFDADQAQHEWRMAQLTGEGNVKIRQMELDHEHRNGQNKAMQTLIEAAVGGGGNGSDTS